MPYKHLVIYALIGMFLLSCGEDKPQINYKNNIDTTLFVEEFFQDTTKMLVAELPIKFDSTETLIFAIGQINLQERGGYSKIGSGSYSDAEIASSYFNKDDLIGNFINLVFHDKSGEERKLTNKKIRIRSVNFLREIFNKTKQGYLLYSISDRDTNGDKELNNSDLEALYLSKADGTQFKKITKELHEFYDYHLINGENTIYFRTLEDINKDGELTKDDKFHYYKIKFDLDGYLVLEHNPLKVFE